MSENRSSAETAPGRTRSTGAGNLWTDLGPVVSFVVVYNLVRRFPEDGEIFRAQDAIYWATGVFMAATAAAIGWSLLKGRRLPPMLILTGVVVFVFGGLTLYLQDPRFAYYKPTIINLLFAAVILGSLAIGRNIWKTAFEHAFRMPDEAWRIFALRWAAFYVLLAVVNELMWRNFSEDVWSNSKLFLTLPLTMGFMFANLPFLMRHQLPDEDSEADPPPRA